MKPSRFCLLIIICLGVCDNIDDEWNFFKTKYGKNYQFENEEEKRFKIFKKNFDFVQRHNDDYQNSFTIEMNFFGDLDKDDSENADDG